MEYGARAPWNLYIETEVKLMAHQPQCVCQICTCGRHKCPHYRNASHLSFGDDNNMYFPTVASVSAHVPASVEGTSISNDAKSRHNASLAFKRRNQTSQIFQSETRSELASKNEAVKRQRSCAVNGSEPDDPKGSGKRKLSRDRKEAESKVALPKVNGAEDVTVKGEDSWYTKSSKVLANERDSKRNTTRLSQTSRMTVGSNAHREATVIGSTLEDGRLSNEKRVSNNKHLHLVRGYAGPSYVQYHDSTAKDGREEHIGYPTSKGKTRDEAHARGNRVQKEMKNDNKEQEDENKNLDIANGWSTTGKGQQEQIFVSKEVAYNRRHKDSELDDIHVAGYSRKQEPTLHTVGHHNAKHSKDSQLLKGDGSFTGKTVKQIEYVAVKGDRYEMKRPKDSEIFGSDVPVTGKTLNQQEYIAMKGERHKTKRPKDSGILEGDGLFTDKTIRQQERPKASQILENDGSFADKTLKQHEYITVKGERYDVRLPKDSGILQGGGSFACKTANQEEFVLVRGERYDMKRPKDSNILKYKDSLPSSSISHQDFAASKGERHKIVVPKDSDIFESCSPFVGKTINQEVYVFVKGERYDIRRPKDSQIFDEDRSLVDMTANPRDNSRDFCLRSTYQYEYPSFDRGRKRATSFESFDVKTDIRYKDSHQSATSSSAWNRHRVSTKSHFSHGSLDNIHTESFRPARSSYNMDFPRRVVEKCIAGELVESIRKNHKDTPHFHFEKCDHGHHYYCRKCEEANANRNA
ncbi:unnamed protein product [Cylicocyclus nassatus]|uniref:Uncharacterized protein n=1 Tax=Cylicocyclus nassatus TaxID=53992 RepID=A0AA36ME00_CYLNA|nr:unnamed protein product [Cylicocyclus nassatus]